MLDGPKSPHRRGTFEGFYWHIFFFSGVPQDGVFQCMSTIRRQSVRSLAFLQAEWIQMLTNCTSVSIAFSQVVAYGGVQKVCSNDWA